MVRFSVLNKGLENHVEEIYTEHLLEGDHNPNTKRIEMVILNSLFDISVIPLYDVFVNYFGYKEIGTYLENTIIKKDEGIWKTIHPKWDLQLLKHIFSLDRTFLFKIEKSFSELIDKILNY